MLGPWFTERQLCAFFVEKGCTEVTRSRVSRWAGRGLLQFKLIRGVRYYPPEAFQQALEIRDLLLKKEKLEFVERELWWRGYWVHEDLWMPELRATARKLDRSLGRIRERLHRDEDEISDSDLTVFDIVAKSKKSEKPDIILSRLRRRIPHNDEFATVLRVFVEIACGDFEGFDHHTGDDPRTDLEREAGKKWYADDETQIIKALGLSQSERPIIVAKQLSLLSALPPMLQDISRAQLSGSFEDLLDSPGEILAARDDFRNAMSLAPALFEALRWIYNNESFGLRLGDWIAKKSDWQNRLMFVLLWTKLRRTSHDLRAPGEILQLADKAKEILAQLDQLKLFAQDERFAVVMNSRRLQKGVCDETSMARLMKEIKVAAGKKSASC